MQAFLADGTAASGPVGDLVPASCHQHALVCRGEGSKLHGSINDSAHLRFCLSNRRAPCQSSEHADRNFASRRSCCVLRLCSSGTGARRRLSRVNALSIAAGPSARATSIANLWSISSDGLPHISQRVCWIQFFKVVHSSEISITSMEIGPQCQKDPKSIPTRPAPTFPSN